MSAGNCEICGIWDSGLVDGVCKECTTRYSGNIIDARIAFNTAFKDPETPVIKLKRIANLARVSVVYRPLED